MEVVGKRVGNYVIEAPLAQGGMGAVFTAVHPTLGRRAAVKFLDPGLGTSEELVNRFLDEARVTASLRHPNVIDIFDFGELDGRFYYVMELLPGRDLAADLKSIGKYPPMLACQYIRQIASGLAAAHGAGIVHRDLKPANVFVLEEGRLHVKLMDFGVAKIERSASGHTSYGQVLGTPAYMAPEQALGQLEKITAQSDLYSLGVIAYEMLSGGPLFQHAAPMMLLVMHIHEPARPLRSVAPEVPEEIAELVDQCLRKDPLERPSSAREVVSRLAAILVDEKPPDSLASAPRVEAKRIVQPTAPQANPFDARTINTNSGVNEAVVAPAHPVPAKVPDAFVAKTVNTNVDVATIDLPEPSAFESGVTVSVRQPKGSLEPEKLPFRSLDREAPPQGIPVRSLEPAKSPASAPEAPSKASLPKLATPILVQSKIDPRAKDGVDRDILELSEPDLGPEPPQSIPVVLTDEDRNTLGKLLQRMQRKGDLPAFVQNVGEVNKRSDVESGYSARQLSDSILKDYSLTARLLRVVNSSYVNRFGGKIYTIQHAIVILGFEKVRQLALSVAMFGKDDSKAPARVSDSAVHALVSGEIARILASRSGIKDADQAMLAAMFRNLGRHLTIVYLPELYDQIVLLSRREAMSQEQAATRILGLSMHKLGMGIAEKWYLPKRFLDAMSSVPVSTDSLATEEERLASLARLTNDLSDLVASGIDGPDDSRLRGLFERHRNLLRIDPKDLEGLIEEVGESFRTRYAALLGAKVNGSRFLQNLSTLGPTPKSEAAGSQSGARSGISVNKPSANNRGTKPVQSATSAANEAGRNVFALKLGKVAEVQPSPSPGESLEEQIARLKPVIGKTGPSGGLDLALDVLSKRLGVPRLLALRANEKKTELRVSRALGDDAEGLSKALSFSLGGSDVFSLAFREGRDIFIKDSFSEKASQQVPVLYYEAIGSPSFCVIFCGKANQNATVLLADVGDATALPSRQKLEELKALRDLIAEAAA